jgi:hypothetical protein
MRQAEFYWLSWKARRRRLSRGGPAARQHLKPGMGFKQTIAMRYGRRHRQPSRRPR